MKKTTIMILMFLLIIGDVYAQQEKGIVGVKNWLNNWTEFNPNQENYDEPTQILTGNITSDTKLFKGDIYLLLGNVMVTNNATLTIEPGTVIIGDYKSKASLTISKGSKIVADGLATDPIVFTSNRGIKRAGDWGGIIILGDAPTNKFGNGSVTNFYTELSPDNFGNTNYGGQNPNSNSGVLRFVRIEYAGKRLKSIGHFKALLLAGVGSETIIENVMVSFAGANSFEIWGGQVTLEKAVSYKSNGNDFTFNYGSQSKLLNSLVVRSPYISSNEGARCVKIASYEKKEEVDFSKKGTSVFAENLTLFNITEDLNSEINLGLVKEGVYVGHNTSFEMNKSVISGFNPAVLFEDKIKINQGNLEKIKFRNMYFNNCNGNIFVENNSNNEDLENWYGNTIFSNVYSKSFNSETFIDFNNERRPDFRLRINKIMASMD